MVGQALRRPDGVWLTSLLPRQRASERVRGRRARVSFRPYLPCRVDCDLYLSTDSAPLSRKLAHAAGSVLEAILMRPRRIVG